MHFVTSLISNEKRFDLGIRNPVPIRDHLRLRKYMKPSARTVAALCLGITSLAAPVFGQSITGHYPAGAEGIRSGTTPPPGHYTKSYNLFYWADELKGPGGQSLDPNFYAFTFATAVRHFWITDIEILGANYGMDMAVLAIHNDLEFSTPGGVGSRSSTGFGDMLFQPVLLGWHGDQWDIGALYGMWIPTGHFDPKDPSSVGRGFWTHQIGLGGTWYPDKEKSWSFSLANRVEWHTENDDLEIRPGAHYSMEWGAAKRFANLWELGAVGTITQKISDDRGPGVTYDPGIHDRVYSVGAELTKFFPDAKLFGSVRWFHEFGAEARAEGDAIWFSLARLW